MAIDDLANREHDCDLLLDQNFDTSAQPRYAALVPRDCLTLIGPRYALLAPEYASPRGLLRLHSGRTARVAVFFGGSDPYGATELALTAMAMSKLRDSHVDVVLGANHAARHRIEALAGALPLAEIHGTLPSLSALMKQADLAIGAAGVTTWERMCLGVPSVVVSVADNQLRNAEALAESHHIIYAGPVSAVSPRTLARLLDRLQEMPGTMAEMSIRGQLLVDGRGAERLAEALFPSARADLRLRSAASDDAACYFAWASDPLVRANAIDTEPFTWTSHEAWFQDKLHSSASHLFVLEVGGLPVGQIRFDDVAGEMRIDYSLDALVRGRGWGTPLVALGVARIREVSALPLRAVVKPGNEASHAVFRKLGFAPEPGGPKCPTEYVLEPRDRRGVSVPPTVSRGTR
jgi:spore coat polysaccharide biosynthesis predicted glycosyltransferase SpsG